MKILVLAEKPSVGKDIARVLNCRKTGNGFCEGDNYVVTWALGHLVTLKDPEKYKSEYKTWDINHLPIMPDKLELEIIGKTAKQYGVVKELLNRKDINEIVIATDAGREGELVARWILEKANCKKQIKRLWISSVTDKAIKDGFAKLKDGKLYLNLYQSAKARAEADWLVGINATRCLTTKHNSQLSCGRVQTPTVALIYKRENDIKAFVPHKFYGIAAECDGLTLVWQDTKSGSIRIEGQNKCKEMYENLKKEKQGVVTEITKNLKKTFAPKLYDLTTLQRDANTRYGFSPKETLSIMQKLYEQHKVLSYPRTDSCYISKDIVDTIPERLRACSKGTYGKICAKLLQVKILGNPHFVDDKKVSDHHAIIPTEQTVDFSELSLNERKIYDLVITRFLAVLYPPFEYEQTSVKVRIGLENFIAKGKIVIKQGFKEIYSDINDDDNEDDLKEQIMPNMSKGDYIKINNLRVTEGKTKPPSPFNEATLLAAMENPSKYLDFSDKGIAKILGETGGLGTVATRADIIEKLFDSFLIEKRGKDIFTTSKGRQLLNLAPQELKSPVMTGKWEQKLLEISEGKLNKDDFIKEIKEYTQKIIMEIKQSKETFKHDNITNTKCPECGKFMLDVKGKKGKILVCMDRECGYRKNVSQSINSRCPHCHKMLEMVGENENKRIVCVCGYTEKYDNFVKRKEAEKNVPSKKELQKLINKVNEPEIKNTALANALKDFKF